jgi:hypothetical protein
MATGENAGTWGQITNTNLYLLQQAIGGYQEVSIAGGAQTTALVMSDGAISNARNAVIKLTGTITGNQIVTIPTGIEKTYIVSNGTTGAFTVEFKQAGGTGITFATTDKSTKILFADGTNIVDTGTVSETGIQTLTNKTLTSPIINTAPSATFTTAITLNGTGELRLADTDSSNYVGFKSPGTVSTNRIWTLPSADGTSGQTFVTNGSGVLSFADAGRTGAVNWNTTAVTSSPLTAANGVGYFINTSGGAITVNLPVGSAGAIVSLADYTNTWQTNNVTVTPNGSEKIGGVAASATLNTEGQSVTFVYVDSTEGWKNVQDSTSNVTGIAYIAATGGTISTCGDYKIHTFTGPGTFTVTQTATNPANNTADYLVVAGGGAGAGGVGAGGGAGGYRESSGTATGAYTASPLGSGVSALPVSVTAYPITVGAGGTKNVGPSSGRGGSGSNSVFSTITSTGGGGGGGDSPSLPSSGPGASGGSGGGGGRGNPFPGGSGNTPPTSPSQGTNGENGLAGPARGGGGGGAINAGGTGTPTYGGSGAGTGINPSPTVGTPGPSAPLRYYAGGGGGGGDWPYTGQGANGGTIGGGGPSYAGPFTPATPTQYAPDGTVNTGGGGGGGSNDGQSSGGGSGGSGIVVIRYKFQ